MIIHPQQISQKLELDLEVYSATSLAKDDDLSSSNVIGESYSSISPTEIDKKIQKTKQGTKDTENSMMDKFFFTNLD
jgi:hypothetical protein